MKRRECWCNQLLYWWRCRISATQSPCCDCHSLMLLPSFDLQGKGWLECRLLDQLFYPPAAPSSLPPCRRQKACLVPARCDLPSQCEHSVAHLPSGVPFDSGKEWSTRRCGRVFTALCQTAEAGLNKLFHPRLRLHDSLEKAHFGPRNRGHQSLEWEEGAHHSTVWGAFGGMPLIFIVLEVMLPYLLVQMHKTVHLER